MFCELFVSSLAGNKILSKHLIYPIHQGFPDSSVAKESACDSVNPGWIPGSGRSTGEGMGYTLQYSWASLVAQLVKNLLATRRPGFHPWVGKIPWRRERLPTPVFRPGEFHGLYSPWGGKESDTTERLSLSPVDSTEYMMFCFSQCSLLGGPDADMFYFW